ncbi:phospholipase-like protein [Tanacetum coccineum]
MLGRQMELSGDETDIVPLYYHIVDDFQIQFGREEFCIVTGLRFGVEHSDEYDNDEAPIPFRRRVFPSSLDGKNIIGQTVEDLIESQRFYRLHDDDAVSLCCVGILQLVLLGVEDRRRVPDWILRLANDRVAWDKYPWGSYLRRGVDKKTYSIFGFTWASKGCLPIERLTPDDNEARSEWWVSSRAYFDGVISVAERIPRHLNQQNVYEVPSEFYRDFEEQKRTVEEQKRAVEEMMKKDAERQETYDQGGPSAFRTEPNNSFFKGVPSYGQNMGYEMSYQVRFSK